MAEGETSVTDKDPGIDIVTGGISDPGGALDVPLPDPEAGTLPLPLFTGDSVALAALELGLPAPENGEDSGAAPVEDEFKPPDGDTEPALELGSPPVLGMDGNVSTDEGPEGPPVGMLVTLSDGGEDGPLGPEGAGGLPIG